MSSTLVGLVDALVQEPAIAEAVRRARRTGTAQATEALAFMREQWNQEPSAANQ